MPRSEEIKRGGVLRYRTKKLPNGKYIRFAIVRKRGPHGGRTVAGPVRKGTGQLWHARRKKKLTNSTLE